MRATPRFWIAALLAGVLALIAIAYDSLFPLLGAGGIGAYLLARQVGAARGFITETDAEARVNLSQRHVRVGQEIQAHVTIVRRMPADTELTVTLPLPAGTSEVNGTQTFELKSGSPYLEHRVRFVPEIAGEFDLEPIIFEMQSQLGFFEERLTVGETQRFRARSPQPDDLHVGQGGSTVGRAYGEHSIDRQGGGVEPRELREYRPGDPANRINWRATARLQSPHVLEFEAEADRPAILFVDNRAEMRLGPQGRQMTDYAREVALGLLQEARASNDPLTLVEISDDEAVIHERRATTPAGYQRLADRLRSLGSKEKATTTRPVSRILPRPPSRRNVAGENSFDRILRSYRDWEQPLETGAGNSLAGAIAKGGSMTAGQPWSLIITSDREPQEIRAAVAQSLEVSDFTMVFLLPSILFESDTVTDPEQTYQRYVRFEELRRELNADARIAVFEIGPGDRLDAVLNGARSEAQYSSHG